MAELKSQSVAGVQGAYSGGRPGQHQIAGAQCKMLTDFGDQIDHRPYHLSAIPALPYFVVDGYLETPGGKQVITLEWDEWRDRATAIKGFGFFPWILSLFQFALQIAQCQIERQGNTGNARHGLLAAGAGQRLPNQEC